MRSVTTNRGTSLRTRMDSVITHEYKEGNGYSHDEAVERAPETELPISHKARELECVLANRPGSKITPSVGESRPLNAGFPDRLLATRPGFPHRLPRVRRTKSLAPLAPAGSAGHFDKAAPGPRVRLEGRRAT
jgi:hypothetical protein